MAAVSTLNPKFIKGVGEKIPVYFFYFYLFLHMHAYFTNQNRMKGRGGIAEVILMLSLFKHGLPTFQPSPLPFVLFVSFTLIGVSP